MKSTQPRSNPKSPVRETPGSSQLAALQADRTVTGWFPPELLATYLLVKNSELSYANSASLEQQITHYATTY